MGGVPLLNCGLSPLARGTHQHLMLSRTELRFIPAGAGNTVVIRMALSWTSVYPRWRGEHVPLVGGVVDQDGLSPLARGTHSGRPCESSISRFIPAGAGNTTCRPRKGNAGSVYPRWRGEHFSFRKPIKRTGGLSPLARGTRLQVFANVRLARFIPAGAGNTSSTGAQSARAAVYPRWRGEHSKTTQLNFKPFLAYKKSTNFSVFLKIANSLI